MTIAPRDDQAETPPDDLPTVAGLDDHPLVIEGIVSLLHRSGAKFRWLGATPTYGAFRILLSDLDKQPDIALVDLHLGDGSEPGVVISELTERGIRCVILTSERRPIPIRRAVAAGAVGLIIKSDPPEKVVDVLTQVADGKFAVSSDLAFTFVNDPDVCARLSPREVQVLQLLSEGHTRRGVARSFDPPLSESTVATYLERIFLQYRALGRQVRSTVDAVREATVDGYFGANGEL